LRTGDQELIARTGTAREIGGKAASLAALAASGVSIPHGSPSGRLTVR
jgi:hypothetical protein